MSGVSGLRGLLLQTPVLEQDVNFFTQAWGLDLVPDARGRGKYFRGRSSEPWVLGLLPGDHLGLLRLRLAMNSIEDVVSAHRVLIERGVSISSAPTELEDPGGYFGCVFTDPDGREVELSVGKNASQPTLRKSPDPIRMSHVVLNSPNARETANFYVETLGFQISDWYEKDAIIFLRCNSDHHCLGIGQGKNSAMNHMAFLVDNEAAVLQASEAARKNGAIPLWGPGRHGPGGNVFCYFANPAGVVCEYTAEVIQIEPNDEWLAKEWERTPQNANTWGTGGPTPHAIRLMNGPDPFPGNER